MNCIDAPRAGGVAAGSRHRRTDLSGRGDALRYRGRRARRREHATHSARPAESPRTHPERPPGTGHGGNRRPAVPGGRLPLHAQGHRRAGPPHGTPTPRGPPHGTPTPRWPGMGPVGVPGRASAWGPPHGTPPRWPSAWDIHPPVAGHGTGGCPRQSPAVGGGGTRCGAWDTHPAVGGWDRWVSPAEPRQSPGWVSPAEPPGRARGGCPRQSPRQSPGWVSPAEPPGRAHRESPGGVPSGQAATVPTAMIAPAGTPQEPSSSPSPAPPLLRPLQRAVLPLEQPLQVRLQVREVLKQTV